MWVTFQPIILYHKTEEGCIYKGTNIFFQFNPGSYIKQNVANYFLVFNFWLD